MAMKTASEKVIVMAGLVPAIHALLFGEVVKTWMPGTSDAKTTLRVFRPGMTE